jgi:hypothetical protein
LSKRNFPCRPNKPRNLVAASYGKPDELPSNETRSAC